MSETGKSDETPRDEFVQEFTRHQRRLFLYILAQVPNPPEAEDILQETNLIIWRKYDRYRPGSNFLAWACQIANYEVLKFRHRRRRDRLLFSDELIAAVAEETIKNTEEFERRRRALVHCLGKLRKQDLALIQARYAPGHNGKSIAEYLGRPANSVYQSLGRIRRTLLECINRRVSAETGT